MRQYIEGLITDVRVLDLEKPGCERTVRFFCAYIADEILLFKELGKAFGNDLNTFFV